MKPNSCPTARTSSQKSAPENIGTVPNKFHSKNSINYNYNPNKNITSNNHQLAPCFQRQKSHGFRQGIDHTIFDQNVSSTNLFVYENPTNAIDPYDDLIFRMCQNSYSMPAGTGELGISDYLPNQADYSQNFSQCTVSPARCSSIGTIANSPGNTSCGGGSNLSEVELEDSTILEEILSMEEELQMRRGMKSHHTKWPESHAAQAANDGPIISPHRSNFSNHSPLNGSNRGVASSLSTAGRCAGAEDTSQSVVAVCSSADRDARTVDQQNLLLDKIIKEEFDLEPVAPEGMRDRHKKDVHNLIERRRRYNINDKIRELGSLLPKSRTQDMKMNKGSILRTAVEYLRYISLNQERTLDLLKRQQILEQENRTMVHRIKELECELNSHGIPPLPPIIVQSSRAPSSSLSPHLLQQPAAAAVKAELFADDNSLDGGNYYDSSDDLATSSPGAWDHKFALHSPKRSIDSFSPFHDDAVPPRNTMTPASSSPQRHDARTGCDDGGERSTLPLPPAKRLSVEQARFPVSAARSLVASGVKSRDLSLYQLLTTKKKPADDSQGRLSAQEPGAGVARTMHEDPLIASVAYASSSYAMDNEDGVDGHYAGGVESSGLELMDDCEGNERDVISIMVDQSEPMADGMTAYSPPMVSNDIYASLCGWNEPFLSRAAGNQLFVSEGRCGVVGGTDQYSDYVIS